MEYEVKAVQRVGIKSSADEMSKIIKEMALDGWNVGQLLGSPDQGFIILFIR